MATKLQVLNINVNDIETKQLLEEAEAAGIADDVLFKKTFASMCYECELLQRLREGIDADGEVVTKTYVKGRENLVPHPSINSYVSVSNSMVKHVATIKKLLESTKVKAPTKSALMEIMGE